MSGTITKILTALTGLFKRSPPSSDNDLGDCKTTFNLKNLGICL